ELRHAHGACVLVVPLAQRAHSLVDDVRRSLAVGEALREVDGAVLVRQRRHLGEHRRAERTEPRADQAAPAPDPTSRRRRDTNPRTARNTNAPTAPWPPSPPAARHWQSSPGSAPPSTGPASAGLPASGPASPSASTPSTMRRVMVPSISLETCST